MPESLAQSAISSRETGPRRPPLQLTDSQRKVIENKYLKDESSAEAWLGRVARNVALSELIYHPSSAFWNHFNGVRVSRKDTLIDMESFPPDLSSSHPAPHPPRVVSTWFFHSGLSSARERENNFQRFVENCHRVVSDEKAAWDAVHHWEEQFYEMMASWKFLPNSPTLMNAGRDLQQLSACFVVPVEDSMEGITHALQAQALIHKAGGGTGFSFGQLRPGGDPVGSTFGVDSGVTSFIQVFDKLTESVKQGGNRRGANMGILPYWHPEIKEFIKLKARPGMLENFNLSIAVDKAFFEAVENNWEYDLVNPSTQKAEGRVSAKEIFNLIVEYAWKTGDPGLIFLDHINNTDSNPTPGLGKIEATNPCGEQPLLPNEPCNLGSINLSKFVLTDSKKKTVNWDDLEKTIRTAVRFLDNVIDMNNYPLPEMELLAKGNRRIGLGIMGWAEFLAELNIPYESPEALEFAEGIMGFIDKVAMDASEKLGEERGPFPNWKNSIYDPRGDYFKGDLRYPRNAARTTIAPTGTIGLAAGIQGGGIEPFYAITYTRYNQEALEELKQGKDPRKKDIYFEINPLFKKLAREENFFGLKENELWDKINKNHNSLKGIKEIPEDIQRLFPTAHDLDVETHVKMQAAFQKFTNNGVSKTINLPHEASEEDVARAFRLAYREKCKGITVYRDRSREQQVLNLLSGEKKIRKARDFSVGVSSEYFEIRTGHGPLHVHIDYDEMGLFRVSCRLGPAGSEISGLTTLIGDLVSKALEEGVDPRIMIKSLRGMEGNRIVGWGSNKTNSISQGLALALSKHMKKHHADLPPPEEKGGYKEEQGPFELWNLYQKPAQCPGCGGTNLVFNAGCSGPICHECGYSECS